MKHHGRADPQSFAGILGWTRLLVLLAGCLLITPALQAQGEAGLAPVEGDSLVGTELASDGVSEGASLFRVPTVPLPVSHRGPFIFTQAAQADLSVFSDDRTLNVGTNGALMTVGAAAIGIGLLIGGDAGTAVAVTGGGVALVGLFRFMR